MPLIDSAQKRRDCMTVRKKETNSLLLVQWTIGHRCKTRSVEKQSSTIDQKSMPQPLYYKYL